MGLRIKRQTRLPIGVDLGTTRLKMAQLRNWANSVELLAAGSAEIPPDCREDPERRLDFQAGAARRILKSAGFKGRKAVLSLPAGAVFVQPVKIPVVPPDQVDLAVIEEVQARLPYPAAEAIIRHMPTGTVYGEKDQMQERIVVAVRRGELAAYLAMARRAGLDVVRVNIEACALVECFARLFRRASDESRVTLFVDMGSASTQVVLARGQKMIFARNLPVGGHTLDLELSGALQISCAQAQSVRRKMLEQPEHTAAEDDLFRLLDVKIAGITEDITDCLRYYESSFRNRPIERVVFLGGQAHDKRLCQAIAERLNLPAQVGDPMAGVKRPPQAGWNDGPDPRQPQPAWAVAIGLSLGPTPAG